MLYVGVDNHTETSHITVTDEAGEILKRTNIESREDKLVAALEEFSDQPKKAVLEASYNWGKMYDWLDGVADEVVLAHPQKVRAIAEARIKTDKISSETLAHLLRADLIPEAYACSRETRATKRVLRQRMFLVRVQTMFKNRVHAIISQHDLTKPDVTDLFGLEKNLAFLSFAPPSRRPDPGGGPQASRRAENKDKVNRGTHQGALPGRHGGQVAEEHPWDRRVLQRAYPL